MIHLMPCRLYIHLAFTHSVGPSSVECSELGPAPAFPPMRVLEVQWSRARSPVCEVALNSVNKNMKLACSQFVPIEFPTSLSLSLSLSIRGLGFSIGTTQCALLYLSLAKPYVYLFKPLPIPSSHHHTR